MRTPFGGSQQTQTAPKYSRVWGKRNPHQENSEVERGAKWHNVKHEWILILKDLPSHITKGLGKKIQGEIEKN